MTSEEMNAAMAATVQADVTSKRQQQKPWRLRPWRVAVFAGVIFGAWAFTGFMGPNTLINGLYADDECYNFARERKVFPEGYDIRTVNLRMRNGKFVVDLLANEPDKKELQSRVCTVDGNSISIVSKLAEGFWR